jgi:hypothetical protein
MAGLVSETETPMTHVAKFVLASAAFGCATWLSFGWSGERGISLSVESAQARVGRPATAASVAGVARRHTRRGLHRAGVAGAAAVGTAAAIGAAAYNGVGYYGNPYYRNAGYGYGAVPYRPYGYGYRYDCAPGPRVGAFATQPWTDAPSCGPWGY